MLAPVARIEHPEVHEIVASAHCIARFRQRMPIRTPGAQEVLDGVVAALEQADVMRWPPAWAHSVRQRRWWAVSGDLAFPLQRDRTAPAASGDTCLRRASA